MALVDLGAPVSGGRRPLSFPGAALFPLTVLLAGLLPALGGCAHRPAEPKRGPIVLVTLGSLRADMVGGLGGDPALTPNLSALIRKADWAGRAVAASSWDVPAMASLFTGLPPWRHQALFAGRARLSPDLFTLPEALKAAGYRTTGYTSGRWFSGAYGYGQGFDQLQDLDKGWEAYDQLERLGEGRQFVWVHIPEPAVPYVRRGWLLSRLKPGPDGPAPELLPRQIDASDLTDDFDPSAPVPRERRAQLSALYRMNVAWADERLGRLLEALRASGQWDRMLLVVTSDHGEELGEHHQVLHGGSLSRELLEVPLVIKLPAARRLRIAVPPSERVAATRLWATLVEAAGRAAPPAQAASLFHADPAPLLSELYLSTGANQLSLVEGDRRLLWESRFAPAGPALSTAWVEAMDASGPGGPKAPPAPLLAAFWKTPPLAGPAAPRLTLERWGEKSTETEADPRRAEAMARRLAAAWGRFVPGDPPPAEEAREWRDLLARRPEL